MAGDSQQELLTSNQWGTRQRLEWWLESARKRGDLGRAVPIDFELVKEGLDEIDRLGAAIDRLLRHKPDVIRGKAACAAWDHAETVLGGRPTVETSAAPTKPAATGVYSTDECPKHRGMPWSYTIKVNTVTWAVPPKICPICHPPEQQ